jgi:NitT/TauT family transport system permease protein
MIQIKELFKFEGEVNAKTKSLLGIMGWVGMFITWWAISATGIVSDRILPSPIKVFGCYWELLMGSSYTYTTFSNFVSQLFDGSHLLYHIGFSTLVNVLGYLEAAVIAIPLGFLIALYPAPRHLLEKPLNAFRYLPIPAAIGVFIAAFGIGIGVKVNFLAVGILVYLLPVVVQRVVETEKVHKQTMSTLSATAWQKLIHLYIPSVMSRVFVDIIVLVAIGWTYISVIEVVNNQGGLGGIVVAAGRGRTDIIYAILMLIIALGTLQDKLLRRWDRKLFKHKYA